MSALFTSWENRNELRNYPLHDEATKTTPEGLILPDGMLADLNIMLPKSAGEFAFVSSVAVTPGLVSLTIMAASYNPLLEESSENTFIPVAAIAVARPVIQYKHYVLDALYPGVAGWVTFGSDVAEQAGSWRLVSPIDGLLDSRAVRSYRDYPIQSVGKSGRLTELTGLVTLRGSRELLVAGGVRTINGQRKRVITVGLDLTTAPEAVLRKYAGNCGNRPEDRTCKQGLAFVTINNVEPDCNGNIDILFYGLGASQVALTNGMIIDLPIGLDDVCSEFDPAALDPVDECAEVPSSSCSSSDSSSSSSSSSSSAEPAPPAPTTYFDNFDDPAASLATLDQIAGSWYIKNVPTSEAVTGRSRLHIDNDGLPAYIIHPTIRRTASEGYWGFSAVRPIDVTSNAHLIFAYASPDDFWYAGHSINLADSPYGRLYVGHKTADLGSSLDTWPSGLKFGHQFDASGDPNTYADPSIFPGTLVGIDVRVEVRVSAITDALNLVQVRWYWNRSGQGVPNPATPFNTCEFVTAFNMDGLLGMGVAASESHFDNFGIQDLI